MATAAEILASARYDLRDARATQYSQAELLDYLNRALIVLNSTLLGLHSDWVHATDTSTTLTSATNSITQPTGCNSIRSIWYGTDEFYEKSVDYIYDRRKDIGSQTGKPEYWAHEATSVIFDYTADQDYLLTIHYDAKASVLTIADVGGETETSDMPYNDEFNQPLREALIIMAKNREEYDVSGHAYLEAVFMNAAMQNQISRRFTPKRYRLDF